MKRTATPRNDPRVERTRKALFESLLVLIVEKGYDATTVRDVLDRADVGRATFYAHFYNKEDLLLGRMSVFQLDVGNGAQQSQSPTMPDVTRLFEHVARFRNLGLALRGTPVLEESLKIARADLLASFRKFLRGERTRLCAKHADSELLAQFLTGALLHLLLWWLDEGMPEPPSAMNRWFAELGQRALTPSRA